MGVLVRDNACCLAGIAPCFTRRPTAAHAQAATLLAKGYGLDEEELKL